METLFRPAVNDLATSQVIAENDTNVASPIKKRRNKNSAIDFRKQRVSNFKNYLWSHL